MSTVAPDEVNVLQLSVMDSTNWIIDHLPDSLVQLCFLGRSQLFDSALKRWCYEYLH